MENIAQHNQNDHPFIQRQQEVGSAFVKVFEGGRCHRQFFICHDSGLPFQRNGIHHLVVHHFGY